jgi:ABC-2 type transport system permease protein
LTGVVEEKTTGVVEVLLGHVRAYQLLTGKVFGIGVVALTQMTATVASALVALRISGGSVPRDVWIGLPTTLLWFLLGFVLYSTLFALAGSFVSRQEDAQGAAAPISLLFTASYFTVFVLGNSPYSGVTRVVSVLPPFAPLLMPLRVSVGAASIFEIVVAAIGLLLATFGMLRLAGRVYGGTLLHRGSRLQWKQALRMRS